jgi:FtsH-binding integral membrane protein
MIMNNSNSISDDGYRPTPLDYNLVKLRRNTFILLCGMMILTMVVMWLTSLFVTTELVVQTMVIGGLIALISALLSSFRAHKPEVLLWAMLLTLGVGMSLGAALTFFITVNPNAILNAGVATVSIFGTLSVYTIISGKDFRKWGAFLIMAVIGLIITSLVNIFFTQSSLVSLATSYVGVLIWSAFIMYDISAMNKGYNKNYVSIAIGLYLSIINLFQSLLHIFGSSD